MSIGSLVLLPVYAVIMHPTAAHTSTPDVYQGSQPCWHRIFIPCNDPAADAIHKATPQRVPLYRGEHYVCVWEGTAVPGVVIMEEKGGRDRGGR